MVFFSLAFLAGSCILQFFAILPSNAYGIVTLTLAIGILYTLQDPYRLILMGVLLGFTWSIWYANTIATDSFPQQWEAKKIWVRGTIINLPRVSPQKTSFLLRTQIIQAGACQQHASVVIRLAWQYPPTTLQVGQEWWLPISVKKIHSNFNPGGFDYESWAFQNSIKLSGYVILKDQARLLSTARCAYLFARLRQQIEERVQYNSPQSKTSPWLLALIVGERNNLAPVEWEVLRRTGTNHLMAIAGLHIGLMAGFVYAFINRCWRQFPRWLLCIPAHIAAACGSLIIALSYSALAGFSIPTQRAATMILIFLLAIISRRLIPSWYSWSFALLLVLILNPLNVLSSSFWLSFMTIALILYGIQGRLGSHRWEHWLKPQWVISLGLLPLSIWIFRDYSLVSFIANVIAIPWVGLIILPLCAISLVLIFLCPLLAKFTLLLADKSLSILWLILTWFSHWSWASWQQPNLPIGYLLAAMVGILLLLLPRGFPGKFLGVFWLLPLLTYKPPVPQWGEIQFSLLDVGQGLSAVVQTKNHVLVFDTGAKWNVNQDMGQAVILPFLQSQGIHKLDKLVISHADLDHRGGAQSILERLPVGQIITSVPLLFAQHKVDYCLAGMHWQWDGVNFLFLNPSIEQLNRGNNSSCVLRIATGKNSILLPGDIELEAEKNLLNTMKNDLPSTIIVAPHHGSKTSALKEFIGEVQPTYVLYSIGYLNRYHFPHQEVLKTYNDFGVIAYDTVSAGTIQFTINQQDLPLPRLYRRTHQKYWNHQCH